MTSKAKGARKNNKPKSTTAVVVHQSERHEGDLPTSAEAAQLRAIEKKLPPNVLGAIQNVRTIVAEGGAVAAKLGIATMACLVECRRENLHLTHVQLAYLTGCARPYVSRMVGALNRYLETHSLDTAVAAVQSAPSIRKFLTAAERHKRPAKKTYSKPLLKHLTALREKIVMQWDHMPLEAKLELAQEVEQLYVIVRRALNLIKGIGPVQPEIMHDAFREAQERRSEGDRAASGS